MCGVFVYIYIYMCVCVCCAGNVSVSAPVMRGIFARKRENAKTGSKTRSMCVCICICIYIYIHVCARSYILMYNNVYISYNSIYTLESSNALWGREGVRASSASAKSAEQLADLQICIFFWFALTLRAVITCFCPGTPSSSSSWLTSSRQHVLESAFVQGLLRGLEKQRLLLARLSNELIKQLYNGGTGIL